VPPHHEWPRKWGTFPSGPNMGLHIKNILGKKHDMGKSIILMVINEILKENIRRMNVIDEAINLLHVLEFMVNVNSIGVRLKPFFFFSRRKDIKNITLVC
jgi:hypothetical protein